MTAVDPRLYILGGLLVLAVVVLMYLLGALVRYRRAVRAAAQPVVDVIPAYVPEAPTGVVEELDDDIFAVGPGLTDSTFGGPLRTGAWRPDGQPSAPVWVPQVPPITVADHATPAVVIDAEPAETELEEPAVRRETLPSPEPTFAPASVPALEPEPAPPAPDAEPLAKPEPVPTLASVPEPAPIPERTPAPALPPEPAPMPAHAPEPEIPPEPEPAPVAVPISEPETMALLAEQLRDLESLRAPAGPTVVHAPIEAALDSAIEPARAVDPAPLSTGSVLSAAGSLSVGAFAPPADPGGTSAVEVDSPRVAADVPVAQNVSSTSDSDHEYTLVAPVELYFTLGEGRVGVKQGSRTFAEFQRLADVLIGDVHAAEDRLRS